MKVRRNFTSTGNSSKPADWEPRNFIAPNGFDFRESNSFRMGGKYAQVSYLQILAPELSDELLKNFLILENDLAVTLHIQSIEQTEAIKLIKRKITDLDKMKIEEQKKAIRSGYDMDILPSDLVTYGAEAKHSWNPCKVAMNASFW
jgi:hypothetical protein